MKEPNEEIERLQKELKTLRDAFQYANEENQKLKAILLAINVLTGK